MDEIQEYREPNILGKVVSWLIIGTFGGAIIMLIISSVLFAKTVSISKDVMKNNDTTLKKFATIQKQINVENRDIKQKTDSALMEVRLAIETISGKAEEIKSNEKEYENQKIEVVIDEDKVRQVITEYLSERQQQNIKSCSPSTYAETIDCETEMMLRMLELIMGELEQLE